MKIQIISLFPEMFDGVFNSSMLLKAQKINAVKYQVINLRDYGIGPRKQVDDIPYGGGDGMVLKPEPIIKAIAAARKNSPNSIVILPTPRGELFKQSIANKIALDNKDLIIVCPRYEGYDERIIDFVDMQVCIGNYVLTGGEIPAMVITDSVTRLLPGVLGGETSVEKESFQGDDSTIEHPHYTRPEEYLGMKVPEVLLSGHHAEINKWREDTSS